MGLNVTGPRWHNSISWASFFLFGHSNEAGSDSILPFILITEFVCVGSYTHIWSEEPLRISFNEETAPSAHDSSERRGDLLSHDEKCTRVYDCVL